MKYIYDHINDGSKIIKHSILNIKTVKKTDNGFQFIATLGISVQRVDSNKCLLEIIEQSTKNKIHISIRIQLLDNSIINIEF